MQEEEEEYSQHFQHRVLQAQESDEDQMKLRRMFDRKEDTCQSELMILQSQLAQEFLNDQNKSLQQQNLNSTCRNQLNISQQASEQRYSIDQAFQQDLTNLSQLEQKDAIYNKDQLTDFRQLEDSQQQNYFVLSQSQQRSSRQKANKKHYLDSVKKKSKQESQRDVSLVIGSPNAPNVNILNKDLNLILKIKNKMTEFYLNYTLSGRRSLLKSPKIRQFINDKSDCIGDVNQNWLSNKLEMLYLYFQKRKLLISAKIPLFNPQSLAMFIVQIGFSTINCLFFVLFSTLVVFDAQIESYESLISFIVTVWVIEILTKLNTAIYINTNLIQNRDTIYVNYIKNNAIYDLAPLITLLSSPKNQTVRIVFGIITFIKLKNIGDELVDIQKQLCMAIKNYYYIQILNLILKLFLVAHIISLMYYLVGLIEVQYLGEPSTWFEQSIGAEGSWWKLYLVAFYWSLTLMATGSNIADTTFQIFFTSFIMLFTTIIFGYFLNMIGIILSEIDEQELNKRRDINIINELMRKRNTSKNLQRRVNLDLENFYQINFKKIQEQNEEVLGRISQHLNDQLQNEYFKSILNKISCINSYFSCDSINKLSLHLSEENYIPNQIIFKENEANNLGLLFILEGSIELTKQISHDNSASKTLSVLGKDQVFGQVSFFTGQIRQAQARSKTFTTLIRVSRDKFLNIIGENERDFEQFHSIKDNIHLYKNFEKINIQCILCRKYSHFTSDCPLVHFNKEQLQSKVRYYEKIQQQRVSFQRKQQYINALTSLNKLNEISELFQKIDLLNQQKSYPYEEDSSIEQYEDNSVIPKNEEEEKIFGVYDSNQQNQKMDSSISNGLETKRQNKYNSQSSKTSIIKDDIGENSIKKISYDNQELEGALKKPLDLNLPNTRSNLIIESILPISNQEEIGKKLSIQRVKTKKLDNLYFQENDQQSKKDNLINTNPWLFEKQKDYQIYFPEGNCKIQISKYNRQIRKKIRQNSRKTKIKTISKQI